jgi:hypothetical protein
VRRVAHLAARSGLLAAVAACGWPAPGSGVDAEPARPDARAVEPLAEIGIEGLPSAHADGRLTTVMEAGDCRLLVLRPPTCDPACPSDWWCQADGRCDLDNVGVDAGPVTITGIGAPLELRFDEGYVGFGDELTPTAGAVITAEAPGGTWVGGTAAGFAVAGTAPEVFDVDLGDGVVALDAAAGTSIAWTASARSDAFYRLRIATPHGHGGASDQVIRCAGPDRGEVSIAAELIAGFPALAVPSCVGLTCVPAELSRFTRATAATADGEVTLELGATRWFWADGGG